jgi:hypothetical protein
MCTTLMYQKQAIRVFIHTVVVILITIKPFELEFFNINFICSNEVAD